jgi:hypothetical protein
VRNDVHVAPAHAHRGHIVMNDDRMRKAREDERRDAVDERMPCVRIDEIVRGPDDACAPAARDQERKRKPHDFRQRHHRAA